MPRLVRCAAFLLALVAGAACAAPNPDAQTAWQLLDYVAVDYAGAVKDGKVISAAEYAEMVEFTGSIHARLAALPAAAAQAGLIRQAEDLQAAVAARTAPEKISALARDLAAGLLVSYPMPVAPTQAPDMARAATLYQQTCAACHGATGAGDGPAAAALDPPPIAFADRDRARERSVLALYQVIEQGLDRTSMASYATMPAADRWALAFYSGAFAYPQSLAARGEQLWKDNTLRWPKYWSFSFRISPSKGHPGLISFRMDWLDLLAVQGTLKSFSNTSLKALILRRSAF